MKFAKKVSTEKKRLKMYNLMDKCIKAEVSYLVVHEKIPRKYRKAYLLGDDRFGTPPPPKNPSSIFGSFGALFKGVKSYKDELQVEQEAKKDEAKKFKGFN
ncbi:MAG: hypothetical protein GQ570_04440 [Helicobacteraceae bacterium]|nr:hypothetical protein [Helicobacteraceae bacterium]